MVRAFARVFVLLSLAAPLASAGLTVERLATEYQALRKQRGHFSGGELNDAVDRAGGRKEELLAELGERLGNGTHSRADIIALMGEPDAVLKPGDLMFRRAYDRKDPRVRELLVYHWRGWHDFLYFASDETQVLASGWWAAFE
ncbi:MAG: hypothetical protein KBA31_10410 [Alphaproteobacteria bacterium]|nr:hypothetical protein [Alphaproteobacteria bacterium]